MDVPPETDDYIKESIDHCLGLPISTQTLQLKLRATQESQQQLRDQQQLLLAKLKEKDELIERARTEATVNAQAVKKFVEENEKLATECDNLMARCEKLEKECALYDRDREVLEEFGNEAHERAQEAHLRALDLEQDLVLLEQELSEVKKLKEEHQSDLMMVEYELSKMEKLKENESGDSSLASTPGEESLLESLLATIASKDGSSTCAFLDANSENESCKELLTMWNCLKPSTGRVLPLVAEVKSLENDKENLRINLNRAEMEVKLLFHENSIMEEENKRLVRQCKESNHPGSGGKHTSNTSAESNKRKSSPKTGSPVERKIDFDDIDSARQPLSPLRKK